MAAKNKSTAKNKRAVKKASQAKASPAPKTSGARSAKGAAAAKKTVKKAAGKSKSKALTVLAASGSAAAPKKAKAAKKQAVDKTASAPAVQTRRTQGAVKKSATKQAAVKKSAKAGVVVKVAKTAAKSSAAAPARASKKRAAAQVAVSNEQVANSLDGPAQLSLQGVLPQPNAGVGLDVGDRLPDFVLFDQHGARVSAENFRGAPLVVYFYPKDDTPGCTTEACGFRDEVEAFAGAGVTVVGVSPDKPGSHSKFATKYDLNFQLLADVDRVLCLAFGVWKLKKNYGREYYGVERSTFLVGANGKIVRAWRGVRVAGHVAQVLEAAKSL